METQTIASLVWAPEILFLLLSSTSFADFDMVLSSIYRSELSQRLKKNPLKHSRMHICLSALLIIYLPPPPQLPSSGTLTYNSNHLGRPKLLTLFPNPSKMWFCFDSSSSYCSMQTTSRLCHKLLQSKGLLRFVSLLSGITVCCYLHSNV